MSRAGKVATSVGRIVWRFLCELGTLLKTPRRNRIPFRRQMSDVECGAACLAMVLSYYGRNTGVAETREHCNVGRDGLTALAIAQAARSYGLRTKAYSLEPAELGHVRLPAILHWNFDHFIVLEKWSPKRVTVADPAVGRYRLSTEEFNGSFTGVALTLEPESGFERRAASGQRSQLAYLRHILRTPGVRTALAQVLAASAILSAVGLVVPLFTKVVVDEVLPARVEGALPILGLVALVVCSALLMLNYLRGLLVVYLQAKLDTQVMLSFFEHVLSLPYEFFQRRSSGDLLVRLASNTAAREVVTSQIVSILLNSGLALSYAAILLSQAPLFGGVAILIGMVQATTLLWSLRPMNSLMQRGLSAQAQLQGYTVESLTGIATLKASGAERRAFEHWSSLFYKQLNLTVKAERLASGISAIISTLSVASPVLLLLIGAAYVLDGSMSLGTMLALQAMATQFLSPLSSLISSGQYLQTASAHLERIMDAMRVEPEQAGQGFLEAPPLAGRIELRRVSFRYDRNSPWALHDVSVSIESGQKVALVGRTGSGKSTLAKLLLGLYEPTEGQILYDGIPLEQLDYHTLRSQFGTVLQDDSVFSGSMRQNISFNEPNMPFWKIEEAAELAVIHEDIEQMPMGYETSVAEGGAALSGGQRQRLVLARALASKPALLVLDEATSHLDARTEEAVGRNVGDLSCTRVVVAHRLSTVCDADQILVLESGEIVERGTHEDLLTSGGTYAALVQGQLGHQLDTLQPGSLPPAPRRRAAADFQQREEAQDVKDHRYA